MRDNIHWWGKGTRPSTPGAFHAAHLNWRWGRFLQKGDAPSVGPFKSAGKKQFSGNDIFGVLLDSTLPNQTIKFGVLKDASSKRFEELLTSNSNLEDAIDLLDRDLFGNLFKVPDKIDEGENLSLWYAIEVINAPRNISRSGVVENLDKKTEKMPFEGNLFIHGLFFPHEPEPGYRKPVTNLVQIGSRNDIYKNPKYPARVWSRNPIIP